LVQACGLTVDQALANFAVARPPGVKHERFVAELQKRYNDATDSSSVDSSPAVTGGAVLGAQKRVHTSESRNREFTI
jgi:hypothetical protein